MGIRWSEVSGKIRAVLIIIAIMVAGMVAIILFPLLTCDDSAEAASATIESRRQKRVETARREYNAFEQRWDDRERESEERWRKLEEDSERERLEAEARASKNPPKKRRRVRRFAWESPAETRGKIWNIPQEESDEALIEAFLRVCIAEADGYLQDCVGIWQVIKNIRRRSCSRGAVRKITECEENGGETMMSVLRRSQRHILGNMPLRNRRAAWIRNLTADCENPPEEWTGSENEWDAQYGSKRCPRVVELARYLIKGELPPSAPGRRLKWLPGRPITWGGRCESGKASCDDPIACARGLARVSGVDYTKNAFWCKIKRGCRNDAEPVCVALGYGAKNKQQPNATSALVSPGPSTPARAPSERAISNGSIHSSRAVGTESNATVIKLDN